jgi:dTDP-4-amino-4,6-dideoxygalactose transaminase
MKMTIKRTLPPAASPLGWRDILAGLAGLLRGSESVRNFETEIKGFYLCRHCFAVSSGKAALALILEALHEIRPGRDEVLIPAYTCYSVPSAIVRTGLKVRLCDVEPKSLDFDFPRLEEQIANPRLLCVIPTHLFGLPADVEKTKELAGAQGLFVVEDAAQSMGGQWQGRMLGTIGDVGFFSLGRGKAFSTVEGGLIVTDDDEIGRALARKVAGVGGYGVGGCLRLVLYALALALFVHPRLYWFPRSLPFLKLGETIFDPSFPIRRLSAFQAGLARGWAARIAEFQRVRIRNARTIADCGIPALGGERSLPCLIRYPVLATDVEAKRKILNESEREGRGIANGYPDSIDGIRELGEIGGKGAFPAARDVAARLLCLPIHSYVRERDLQEIARSLR